MPWPPTKQLKITKRCLVALCSIAPLPLLTHAGSQRGQPSHQRRACVPAGGRQEHAASGEGAPRVRALHGHRGGAAEARQRTRSRCALRRRFIFVLFPACVCLLCPAPPLCPLATLWRLMPDGRLCLPTSPPPTTHPTHTPKTTQNHPPTTISPPTQPPTTIHHTHHQTTTHTHTPDPAHKAEPDWQRKYYETLLQVTSSMG